MANLLASPELLKFCLTLGADPEKLANAPPVDPAKLRWLEAALDHQPETPVQRTAALKDLCMKLMDGTGGKQTRGSDQMPSADGGDNATAATNTVDRLTTVLGELVELAEDIDCSKVCWNDAAFVARVRTVLAATDTDDRVRGRLAALVASCSANNEPAREALDCLPLLVRLLEDDVESPSQLLSDDTRFRVCSAVAAFTGTDSDSGAAQLANLNGGAVLAKLLRDGGAATPPVSLRTRARLVVLIYRLMCSAPALWGAQLVEQGLLDVLAAQALLPPVIVGDGPSLAEQAAKEQIIMFSLKVLLSFARWNPSQVPANVRHLILSVEHDDDALLDQLRTEVRLRAA